MRDIKLDELEHTIVTPSCVPKPGARLAIAERPEPFVAPTLRLLSSDSPDPFFVEVVFVQSSAAVGKTVIAEYLSSSRQAPLLNLAEVPVSTHSLMGLIQSDLSGVEDPVQAFHTGTLPLIIDALDEGRLLSGEQGFERFLETTGELLLRDRSVMNRPKIVLFGRHDSTELAPIFQSVGRNRRSFHSGYAIEGNARGNTRARTMERQGFVQQTLVQIIAGVKAAQAETGAGEDERVGGAVNPQLSMPGGKDVTKHGQRAAREAGRITLLVDRFRRWRSLRQKPLDRPHHPQPHRQPALQPALR